MVRPIYPESWSDLYILNHGPTYISAIMVRPIYPESWSDLYIRNHGPTYISGIKVRPIYPESLSDLYILNHGPSYISGIMVRPIYPESWSDLYILNHGPSYISWIGRTGNSDGRDRVQPAYGPGRRRDEHHAGRTMLWEARGSRQSIIQSSTGTIRDNCMIIAVHG